MKYNYKIKMYLSKANKVNLIIFQITFKIDTKKFKEKMQVDQYK